MIGTQRSIVGDENKECDRTIMQLIDDTLRGINPYVIANIRCGEAVKEEEENVACTVYKSQTS